eukprot:TRINITY_DN7228_c0_g1_i1.p1 TRINITY_DN7228_c0_g1~~TRINITY_DN7228_c0_g1_i1.p1  ORF type:complete len:524 (+),score=109.00 TRINITY_DN7228_c0_g1_i1:77-1573(+)
MASGAAVGADGAHLSQAPRGYRVLLCGSLFPEAPDGGEWARGGLHPVAELPATAAAPHVAASGGHALVAGGGIVYGRGENGSGQLTLEGGSERAEFFTQLRCGAAAQVACGGNHSLLLTEAGEVLAAGSDCMGQLGCGEDCEGEGFECVPGLDAKVVGVAAGFSHSAAVTDQGALLCCGYNGWGQLGLGDRSNRSDFAVVRERGVTSVACGTWHTVALLADGSVAAAGRNDCGQLGQPAGGEAVTALAPSELPPGCRAVAAAAGGSHTVLLLRGGGAAAAGANETGQLDGEPGPARSEFAIVPGLSGRTVLGCAASKRCTAYAARTDQGVEILLAGGGLGQLTVVGGWQGDPSAGVSLALTDTAVLAVAPGAAGEPSAREVGHRLATRVAAGDCSPERAVQHAMGEHRAAESLRAARDVLGELHGAAQEKLEGTSADGDHAEVLDAEREVALLAERLAAAQRTVAARRAALERNERLRETAGRAAAAITAIDAQQRAA